MTYFGTSDAKVTLPQEVTATIFDKARETSVVARLANSTPLTLAGSQIPVYEGEVNLGTVAEGGRKPIEKPSASVKTITPVKMAAIVPVSEELVRTNPGGMFDAIQADLSDAVGRALDALMIHGVDARTGNAIAGQTSISDTTHVVELAGGDYKAAVLSGFDLVGENYDVNGIAADSRTKTKLLSVVNEATVGLPDLSAQNFTVAGVPTAFGRSVGRAGGAEQGVKLAVGDWSKVRYGFASGIEITRSNEATLVQDDGTVISLFQENLVALRVETFIGGVVLDDNAFALVKDDTVG